MKKCRCTGLRVVQGTLDYSSSGKISSMKVYRMYFISLRSARKNLSGDDNEE